jgi:hypothetical protein
MGLWIFHGGQPESPVAMVHESIDDSTKGKHDENQCAGDDEEFQHGLPLLHSVGTGDLGVRLGNPHI